MVLSDTNGSASRLENDNLRVFNVHPGMAKSPVLRKELELYAHDSRGFHVPVIKMIPC